MISVWLNMLKTLEFFWNFVTRAKSVSHNLLQFSRVIVWSSVAISSLIANRNIGSHTGDASWCTGESQCIATKKLQKEMLDFPIIAHQQMEFFSQF